MSCLIRFIAQIWLHYTYTCSLIDAAFLSEEVVGDSRELLLVSVAVAVVLPPQKSSK